MINLMIFDDQKDKMLGKMFVFSYQNIANTAIWKGVLSKNVFIASHYEYMGLTYKL